MTEEKSIPFDGDSEEAVIGSLLLDGDSISHIIRIIQPGDFFREKNAWVFEACLGLYNKGVGIDVKTVGAELKAAGQLEGVGGPPYLIHCLDAVPTSTHVAHYAQIVAKHAQSRKLISLAGEIARMGYDGEEGALNKALERLVSLVPASDRGLLSPSEWASRTLDDIARRQDGNRHTIPLPWGNVDRMTAGMAPGEMVVVGARPGVGKTTLLQHIAQSTSGTVLFVSAEMSDIALAERHIANCAGISMRSLRIGQLTDDAYAAVQDAIGELGDGHVWPLAGKGATTTDIRAAASEILARAGNLSLIVVDYLQILADKGGDSNQVRTANISRTLKLIAQEFHVPLLVACQLNRSLESRIDKRPTLADLRDSGAIEQDADIVLFLFRDDVNPHTQSEHKGELEIIQAKHRQLGEVGHVKLRWDPVLHQYRE